MTDDCRDDGHLQGVWHARCDNVAVDCRVGKSWKKKLAGNWEKNLNGSLFHGGKRQENQKGSRFRGGKKYKNIP